LPQSHWSISWPDLEEGPESYSLQLAHGPGSCKGLSELLFPSCGLCPFPTDRLFFPPTEENQIGLWQTIHELDEGKIWSHK